MASYASFIKQLQSQLGDMGEQEPESPEELRFRQQRNMTEWDKAWQMAKDPKQKEILLAELVAGRGVDFPAEDEAEAEAALAQAPEPTPSPPVTKEQSKGLIEEFGLDVEALKSEAPQPGLIEEFGLDPKERREIGRASCRERV